MVADPVDEWLGQVARDLSGARDRAHGPEPVPDRAAFFIQQAAEKLVKAVLIAYGRRPAHGHDIVDLVGGVPSTHPDRPALLALGRFTRFAVVFRYPSEEGREPEPTADDVDRWIAEIAEARLRFERWLAARRAVPAGEASS